MASRRTRWLAPAVVFLAAVAIDLIWSASFAAPGAGDSSSQNSEWLIKTWETGDGLPDNSVTAITQTPDGYLWFSTFNGLVRFNGVEFKVLNLANTPQLPGEAIVNLHLDKAGRLLLSTYRGMAVLDGAEWRVLFQTQQPDADIVRTFADRANGDVLITTFNGKLLEFSHGQLSLLPAPPGASGEGYLGGVDEEGHWWAVQYKFIGRLENGHWVRMISPPDLPGEAFGVAPALDGGMWLLMGHELCKLRRGVEVSRQTLPELSGGVWSMSEDRGSNVWIATYNQGFYRISVDGRMSRWNASSGWSNNGRCIFEDRENNLWVGTSGDGLLRVTPRRFRHLDLVTGEKGVVVQSVCADRAGGIWAATYGRGLFHLSDREATNVPLASVGLASEWLQSVLIDRSDRVWWDPLKGRFNFWTKLACATSPERKT
jgi:ligand-binding sensor domain-containing protein